MIQFTDQMSRPIPRHKSDFSTMSGSNLYLTNILFFFRITLLIRVLQEIKKLLKLVKGKKQKKNKNNKKTPDNLMCKN